METASPVPSDDSFALLAGERLGKAIAFDVSIVQDRMKFTDPDGLEPGFDLPASLAGRLVRLQPMGALVLGGRFVFAVFARDPSGTGPQLVTMDALASSAGFDATALRLHLSDLIVDARRAGGAAPEGPAELQRLDRHLRLLALALTPKDFGASILAGSKWYLPGARQEPPEQGTRAHEFWTAAGPDVLARNKRAVYSTSLIEGITSPLQGNPEKLSNPFGVQWGQSSAFDLWSDGAVLHVAAGRRAVFSLAYDLRSGVACLHGILAKNPRRVPRLVHASLLAVAFLWPWMRFFLFAPPRGFAPQALETHIGHHLWNELAAIWALYESAGPEAMRALFVMGRHPEHFGLFEDLMPELSGNVHRNAGPMDGLRLAMASGTVSVTLGSNLIPEALAQRIVTVAKGAKEASDGIFRPLEARLAPARTILRLLIGIRVGNRFWPGQHLGYAALIRRLVVEGYAVAAILDSHNAGAAGAPIYSSKEALQRVSTHASESPHLLLEREVFARVEAEVADLVQAQLAVVGHTLGAPVAASIVAATECDFMIAHWGAGLAKYKWVANAPGIVFTSEEACLKNDFLIYDMAKFRPGIRPSAVMKDVAYLNVGDEADRNARDNFSFDAEEFAESAFNLAHNNQLLPRLAAPHAVEPVASAGKLEMPAGGSQPELPAGWRVSSTFPLGGGLALKLILASGSKAVSGWLVDGQGRLLDVYGEACPAAFEGPSLALEQPLAQLRRRLLDLAAGREPDGDDLAGVEDLARRSPVLLQAFLERVLSLRDVRHIMKFHEFAAEFPGRCGPNLREAFIEAADNPLSRIGAAAGLTASGQPSLQPILGATTPEVIRCLPLTYDGETAILTIEDGVTCWRLGATKLGKGKAYTGGFVYLPDHHLLLHRWSRDVTGAADMAARVLSRLLGVLLRAGAATRATTRTKAVGVGILGIKGVRHLGHTLCDEMHIVISALRNRPNPPLPMHLLLVQSLTGIDLYDPVDLIFPEFEGRIGMFRTLDAALAYALPAGLNLVRGGGRRVPLELKRRMLTAATMVAEQEGLTVKLDELARNGAVTLPFVGFGLRLMNRRPVDFLGFLTRLAEGLHQRIGPFVLVLDGLNESGDGRAVTRIDVGKNPMRKALSDGAHELEEEYAFVRELTNNLSHLPIRVLSCVGMPIMQNIYCLSRCCFMVAPNGAGLAKFRWSLDIPGFILTSQINLKYCRAVDLYSHPGVMEGPFSSLHYTDLDEVKDEVPAEKFVIPERGAYRPLPQNFWFADEGATISRIIDLIQQAQVERHDDPSR